MTAPIPERVAARAATRYDESPTGCWISRYSVGSHRYAQVGWIEEDGSKHATTAHRAAWVHYAGRQPAGTVDHFDHCDRRCVRPDHLRDIPNWDNARKNRPGSAVPTSNCVNGHNAPVLEKIRGGKVWRTCSQCNSDRAARANAKARERKNQWAREKRARKVST